MKYSQKSHKMLLTLRKHIHPLIRSPLPLPNPTKLKLTQFYRGNLSDEKIIRNENLIFKTVDAE